MKFDYKKLISNNKNLSKSIDFIDSNHATNLNNNQNSQNSYNKDKIHHNHNSSVVENKSSNKNIYSLFNKSPVNLNTKIK